MNPYRDVNSNLTLQDGTALVSSPTLGPNVDSHEPSPSLTLPSPAVIHVGMNSNAPATHNPLSYQTSPQTPQAPNLRLASDPDFNSSLRSGPQAYPLPPTTGTPIIILATNPHLVPDLHLSPHLSVTRDSCPDLECAVCFSQFNNIFRCPKMLHCRHTFCLECLARINVKSAQPTAIQCPLCRFLTPLPTLGPPKLATNWDILSFFPDAMQRVYSIRYNRSKGRLQVKRSSEVSRCWDRRSLTSLTSVSHTVDVGLPSPTAGGPSTTGEEGGMSRFLVTLTGKPGCRAFLVTLVVLMMALLTGIITYLLTYKQE